jgi:hypothetical protein
MEEKSLSKVVFDRSKLTIGLRGVVEVFLLLPPQSSLEMKFSRKLYKSNIDRKNKSTAPLVPEINLANHDPSIEILGPTRFSCHGHEGGRQGCNRRDIDLELGWGNLRIRDGYLRGGYSMGGYWQRVVA